MLEIPLNLLSNGSYKSKEDLRIKNMVKRAKPTRDGKVGYKRNGGSRKTGLNRVILDAGWGDINQNRGKALLRLTLW